MSGILLFACMFLPAVKGCHQPVMPYEVPPFMPPYLYGLVLAVIAMYPTLRVMQWGSAALRVLGALIILGSVVLVVVAPPVGIVELVVGTVLLVTIAPAGTTERRIAATGVEVAIVSTLWFGAWALSDDALLGVYLSLASSLGLLVGCIAWLRELADRPTVDVPRAVTSILGHRAPPSPETRFPTRTDRRARCARCPAGLLCAFSSCRVRKRERGAPGSEK
jgi:hypothetical protein